jgi:hypothetical protein
MRNALFAAAIFALSACNTMTPISESKPVGLSSSQLEQIKATVTYDFFDPSSAMFREIRAVDVTLANGTTERRVCGEVNGKNRMGGYVGYSMFGGLIENGGFRKVDFFAPCEAW